MIAQKNARERFQMCVVCIFFMYMCSQKMYVQSLSTGWQKNAKEKGKNGKKRHRPTCIRSPVLFFQTTILCTIATFQIFFLVLLVILSPPFLYKLLFLLIKIERHICYYGNRYTYTYIYSLSFSFFWFVYIKTYTSFFNVNENNKRNDNYSFSFLNNYTRQNLYICVSFFFSFNLINDDKWLTIERVYIDISLHYFVV